MKCFRLLLPLFLCLVLLYSCDTLLNMSSPKYRGWCYANSINGINPVYMSSFDESFSWAPNYITINGNTILLYDSSSRPWNYVFKVIINGFNKPSDSEMKKYFKNNSHFNYSGTVYYYVCDRYPNIKNVINAMNGPFIRPTSNENYWAQPFGSDLTWQKETVVERSTSAQIEIRYIAKNKSIYYEISFDGVKFILADVEL